MPVLAEVREEVAGVVPFRPIRRDTDRTGGRQRGCVGVAEGVELEESVAVGVGVGDSVAEGVALID